MPWKEETIMSQKVHFIQSVLENKKPFSQLCKDYQISRKTGYLILNSYNQHGLAGLKPKSKSPHHKPTKTSDQIEEEIIKARIKYSWGPKKIETYLKNKNTTNVPSISTIAAILKRRGYINPEESLKRQKLIRFEREFSNDLWQMDFKGKFQLENKKTCYPLTILDDYSRFSIDIRSCSNERHGTVFHYLNRVFMEYGLPKQFNVDNGNPWGHSQLLKHTALTVWLMRLGIKVTHSRPYHPQTNGKIERFHRTLKKDVISRNKIVDFSHAQKLFDEWRKVYNEERPHEAIGMLVPAKRYQQSTIKMPEKLPRVEYDDGSAIFKVRGNGYVTYKGRECGVGEAFKGLFVEVKEEEPFGIIEIYFGKFKIHTYTVFNT